MALQLGAGRTRKEDDVDPAVGVEVLVEQADQLTPDRPLFRVHHQGALSDEHKKRLLSSVTLMEGQGDSNSRTIETVRL